MAEKKLLAKLNEEYLTANISANNSAIASFCAFAGMWLADQSPTGISYTVNGLMLRFANGDSFVLVAAPDAPTSEKKLFEKLREEYLLEDPAADNAAIVDFCGFAETWLATQSPTGISYAVDGLMLRFANGDSFLLVASPETELAAVVVAVTGVSKLNMRAAVDQTTDFPITGR